MRNVEKSKNRLMLKLAFSITILIVIIEVFLLAISVQKKERDLISLRTKLEIDVVEKTNKNFHDLHPNILDDKSIKREMLQFKINVALMTLLISFVVVSGTMAVFYHVAGKHILRAIALNKNYDINRSKDIPRYPEEEIPDNELGDLLSLQNQLLDELQSYQENLEEKLDEAKLKIDHQVKLSTAGEMTAGITHDIKNPLAAISLSAELLKRVEPDDPDAISELSDKIALATDRISRLVNRMNEFVRKDALFDQKVDVVRAIENSLIFNENKIEGLNVKVYKILHKNTFIKGDELSLEQVLSNIISNACDAMEEAKIRVLTIDAVQEVDHCTILIQDTGKGIEKEKQQSIFESFYTTKSKGRGTGLGLSNTISLLTAMNGEVMVSSEKGSGATFRLKIPLYKEETDQDVLAVS